MPEKLELIKDGETLVSACYKSSGTDIPIYDDGFGAIYIHRYSIGVSGIVRAQSWEDAYSICEDEFFPEADETVDEIVKEYGFKREHCKVIRAPGQNLDATKRHPQLGAEEKFAEPSDYTDNGRLPDGAFVRWETIETPDTDACFENELFCDGFGFRPNGPNTRDKLNHGIYSKDMNGDSLHILTQEMLTDLGITLTIEGDAE